MTASVLPLKRNDILDIDSTTQYGGSTEPDIPRAERKTLVIDIGGSSVKFLATGVAEPRSFRSGVKLSPAPMIERVLAETKDWSFNSVTMGYPGLVSSNGPCSEPGNLGKGWVGFDFASAFGMPVKIVNDAAMQALGSYDGGRMLFIGLGTGVGSALVADNSVITLELGSLWWNEKASVFETIGKGGLRSLGEEKWKAAVERFVHHAMLAFKADYVVIGGGNAKKLQHLPPGSRIGHNLTAFRGGIQMWDVDHVPTLYPVAPPLSSETKAAPEWRMI